MSNNKDKSIFDFLSRYQKVKLTFRQTEFLQSIEDYVCYKTKRKTHQVLHEMRKGGCDIPFSGSLEECIEYCESLNMPDEFNDLPARFWGDEENSYEIVEIK